MRFESGATSRVASRSKCAAIPDVVATSDTRGRRLVSIVAAAMAVIKVPASPRGRSVLERPLCGLSGLYLNDRPGRQFFDNGKVTHASIGEAGKFKVSSAD